MVIYMINDDEVLVDIYTPPIFDGNFSTTKNLVAAPFRSKPCRTDDKLNIVPVKVD